MRGLPNRTPFNLLAITAVSLLLNSCNVYSPLNSPSGDEQILSAARACLDQADYSGALVLYQKLSSNYSNTVASESAYAILDENGADFGAIASSFGKSPNGKGLSALANAMILGAGETRRLALYQAYQKAALITGNPTLQGFVKFMASIALAAEMLAENAGADSIMSYSDLAEGGSSCTTTACGLGQASCNAATGGKFSTSVFAGLDAAQPTGTNPSLDQLYSAITQAVSGLSAMGAAGGTSSSFTHLLGTDGLPSVGTMQAACFRATLIAQGIGG